MCTTSRSGSSGSRAAAQKKHPDSRDPLRTIYEYLQGVKRISIRSKPETGSRRRSDPLLSVEELPQLFARLEIRDPLGRHLDLVAGLGIAPGARAPVADAEAAEAPQLDLLAFLERADDAVEDRVDDDFRVLLGELGRSARPLRPARPWSCRPLEGHRHLPPVSRKWRRPEPGLNVGQTGVSRQAAARPGSGQRSGSPPPGLLPRRRRLAATYCAGLPACAPASSSAISSSSVGW